MPSLRDRGAARALKGRSKGADVAFVHAHDKPRGGFYAREAKGRSAVCNLVTGVRELPEDSDFALRRRILTTAPGISELDRAIVKLAASGRVSHVDAAPPHECADDAREYTDVTEVAARAVDRVLTASRAPFGAFPLPDVHGLPASHLRDAAWLSWAEACVSASVVPDGDEPRYLRDRPVAALLVSADGLHLLDATRNLSGTNRVMHAEMALVLGRAKPLPEQARVLVTLSPCRMCAQALVDAGARDVRFKRYDSGRLAQDTALHRLGWMHEIVT